MINTYNIYANDNSFEVLRLYSIDYNTDTGEIKISPTDSGKRYLRNTFSNLSVYSNDVDLNKIKYLLGINETITFDEFDLDSKKYMENSSFLIKKNEEYDHAKGVNLKNERLINAKSGTIGNELFNNNDTVIATSYLAGEIEGLTKSKIETSPTGKNQKENNEKLIFKHAVNLSISKIKNRKEKTVAIKNKNNSISIINKKDIINHAIKTDIGYRTKAIKNLNYLDVNVSSLLMAQNGNYNERTFDNALIKAYQITKKSLSGAKKDLLTEVCLNHLSGGNELTNDSITFNVSFDSGQVRLKLNPLADLSCSLMSDASNYEVSKLSYAGKAMRNITLHDLLENNESLRYVFKDDPKLLSDCFQDAKKCIEILPGIINEETKRVGLNSDLGSRFNAFLDKNLSADGEIVLGDDAELSQHEMDDLLQQMSM